MGAQPNPEELMDLAKPVEANDRNGKWTAVGYSEAYPTMGFWTTGSSFDDAAQEAYRMVKEYFEYGNGSDQEKLEALELIHTFGWKARVGPFAGLFRKMVPFRTLEEHSMKWHQRF